MMEKMEENERKTAKRGTKGYFHTKDIRLYYEIYGKGMPLIMLHGNGESHRIFYRQARELAVKYQVILVDSRGHGKSVIKRRKQGIPLLISDMAEDLVCLMDYLGIGKAILLGFSDGANVALDAASSHPERAAAVVSVSGNALPSGLYRFVRLFIMAEYLLTCILEHIPYSLKLRKKLIYRRQLAGLMLYSPRLNADRLGQITAPVLLLAGMLDLIRPSHTRWMADMIPHSDLKLIRRATHTAFLKKEKQYMNYIWMFLERRVPGGQSATSFSDIK